MKLEKPHEELLTSPNVTLGRLKMAATSIFWQSTMTPRKNEEASLWTSNFERSHLFRRDHTALLAKPNWRRLRTKHDPTVNVMEFKIPRATLKASPTERIEMLAVPKHKNIPEDPARRPPEPVPVPTVIKEATLKARCKDNTKLLAISKLRKLVVHKETFKDLLGPTFVEVMDKYIKEKEEHMWRPPPHQVYLGLPCALKLKKFDSKAKWSRYMMKLNVFAKPRRDFTIQELPPSKKVPLSRLMKRILELIQLPAWMVRKPPPPPPGVRESALNYEITERVKELSVPRKFYFPDPGPATTPAGVSIAAITRKPDEKFTALATPRDRRNAPDMDLKEDPFSVSPLALKYVCTARMAKLAMPVERSTS